MPVLSLTRAPAARRALLSAFCFAWNPLPQAPVHGIATVALGYCYGTATAPSPAQLRPFSSQRRISFSFPPSETPFTPPYPPSSTTGSSPLRPPSSSAPMPESKQRKADRRMPAPSGRFWSAPLLWRFAGVPGSLAVPKAEEGRRSPRRCARCGISDSSWKGHGNGVAQWG